MALIKCPRTVKQLHTLTVRLLLSNSSPSLWGEYQDDAIGLTPGSDEFDKFYGYYPCILDNGVELGKLNPNNYTQYADGTTAPITTLGKDVMVFFPKLGLKIWSDNGYLYVSVTNEANKSGYTYEAFTYKGTPCSGFYWGAYKGYKSSNKLYSTSGVAVTADNQGTMRNAARSRGTNYECAAYYQRSFILALFLIKYRGQLAKKVLGYGSLNVDATTGGTNTSGLNWGDKLVNTQQMKLFGIEDFYGNGNDFIEGVYVKNAGFYASDGNYNNTGEGYISLNTYPMYSNTSGYLKTVVGTNKGAFLPYGTQDGTSDTYFGDWVKFGAGPSIVLTKGGFGNLYSGYGPFSLDVGSSSTSGRSRLAYFKIA